MLRELNQHDLFMVRRRLPKAVVDLLKERQYLFLAGGFVRDCVTNDKPSDVDLFAPSKDAAEAAALYLREVVKTTTGQDFKIWKTPNAFTVKGLAYPVQFVHRWSYNDPAECLAQFDYTIAMAAVWFGPAMINQIGGEIEKWRSVCDDRFYSDLAARRLVYTCPIREEEPGGSMLRLIKFYQRGYRAPLTTIGQVMSRMVMGVKNLGSIDEERLSLVLRGLLRDVDPMIDPDHIMHEEGDADLDA